MKQILATLAICATLGLSAQDYSVPAASPRQKVEQQFSISKISVDYGRPGVKGRNVYKDLAPYGKVWRAGANSATKISFGQAVNFGGKEVPAGTYGLFIVPEQNQWKVILNKDSQQWGAYAYDEKLNAVEVDVPVSKLNDKAEWFTIELNPTADDSLSMVFKWDTTKVEVPIKVAKPDAVNKMAEKLKEAKQIERESNKK